MTTDDDTPTINDWIRGAARGTAPVRGVSMPANRDRAARDELAAVDARIAQLTDEIKRQSADQAPAPVAPPADDQTPPADDQTPPADDQAPPADDPRPVTTSVDFGGGPRGAPRLGEPPDMNAWLRRGGRPEPY